MTVIVLKFLGRLISPFLLGTVSVHLNILIFHWFRILWMFYGLDTQTIYFLVSSIGFVTLRSYKFQTFPFVWIRVQNMLNKANKTSILSSYVENFNEKSTILCSIWFPARFRQIGIWFILSGSVETSPKTNQNHTKTTQTIQKKKKKKEKKKKKKTF